MLDSKVVAWAFSTLTSRVVSASSVLKIRMSSSSINSSAILNSLSLQIVLNVLDMSILVIKMTMCCAWVLAAIPPVGPYYTGGAPGFSVRTL